MIFQTAIGVDVGAGQVHLAHLQQSFRGVTMSAHSVHAFEKGMTSEEKTADVLSVIREFIAENRIGTKALVIGISDDQVMFREITYPSAVKENLRTTLEYDIDNYVPLSADEICFDFQVMEEDKKTNQLHILLACIKKTDFKPYLSLCKQWPYGVYGLCVSGAAEKNCAAFLAGNQARPLKEIAGELLNSVEAGTEGAFPRTTDLDRAGMPSPEWMRAFGLGLGVLWDVPLRINLLPPEVRKKPGRIGLYALAGLTAMVVLLAAAWVGGAVFQRQMRLKSIEQEIKQLSSEVESIQQMKERLRGIEEKTTVLQEIRGRISILETLKELSLIMPETAWVKQFSFSDKGIRLNGFAQSASELISQLESSPLFKDVVFLSAIVKDNKQDLERFYIGLTSVNPNQSGGDRDSVQ